MKLIIEELRLLAEAERQMDAGEVPWVRVEGASGRASMRPEIMAALGLTTGQTISWFLFGEIARMNLEHCQAQLAYERGQKFLAEEGLTAEGEKA